MRKSISKSLVFIISVLVIYSCNKGEIPTLSTYSPAGITITSALSGGSISSDGGNTITSRGVCWSLNENPDISGSKTNDGQGIGEFASKIAGLNANTTYHTRAYATNSVGTAYGVDMSFTTYRADAVSDKNGNFYNLITIGKQIWMEEDLVYSTDASPSSVIPRFSPRYYMSDGILTDYAAMGKADVSNARYAPLITWGEAMNGETSSNAVPSGVQGVCPVGCHLPSSAEWEILKDYLAINGYGFGGSGNDIAKSMATKLGWKYSVTEGTPGNNEETNNSSGFSGFPVGYIQDGVHYNYGEICQWWSSTQMQPLYYSWSYGITYYRNTLEAGANDRNYRFSIRCLKN